MHLLVGLYLSQNYFCRILVNLTVLTDCIIFLILSNRGILSMVSASWYSTTAWITSDCSLLVGTFFCVICNITDMSYFVTTMQRKAYPKWKFPPAPELDLMFPFVFMERVPCLNSVADCSIY